MNEKKQCFQQETKLGILEAMMVILESASTLGGHGTAQLGLVCLRLLKKRLWRSVNLR